MIAFGYDLPEAVGWARDLIGDDADLERKIEIRSRGFRSREDP